ncbi:MAG: ATP-dependent Clp protease adaptor ClpS [Spirochaetaceae bacterium]|nr:MAG: ATP-dependent Clp protease adaptor ClpS [Spirochaetaceae bacterium]
MAGDDYTDILPATDDQADEKVREPDLYRVILHNDDYTTMDFVIEVLVSVFRKGIFAATRIMLDVHKRGRGEAGRYTYDIARTKVGQVTEMARSREFPLKCTMERA